jgi:hypothetical protein
LYAIAVNQEELRRFDDTKGYGLSILQFSCGKDEMVQEPRFLGGRELVDKGMEQVNLETPGAQRTDKVLRGKGQCNAASDGKRHSQKKRSVSAKERLQQAGSKRGFSCSDVWEKDMPIYRSIGGDE